MSSYDWQKEEQLRDWISQIEVKGNRFEMTSLSNENLQACSPGAFLVILSRLVDLVEVVERDVFA